MVSLDKTLIPHLGWCRALFKLRKNCNLDLQPVEVLPWGSPLHGEKCWNVFLKIFFSNEERGK